MLDSPAANVIAKGFGANLIPQPLILSNFLGQKSCIGPKTAPSWSHRNWNEHETPTPIARTNQSPRASRWTKLTLDVFSVWPCCRNAVPLDFIGTSTAPMLSGLNEDAKERRASGGGQPHTMLRVVWPGCSERKPWRWFWQS